VNNKLKSVLHAFLGIYVMTSFIAGLYFYGQGRVSCIKEVGFFKGFFIGCDVLDGNFGPLRPPNFVASQLKGLVWPYHAFISKNEVVIVSSEGSPIDSTEQEVPKRNSRIEQQAGRPSATRDTNQYYVFEQSIEKQLEESQSAEGDAKVLMRCEALTALIRKGFESESATREAAIDLKRGEARLRHEAKAQLFFNYLVNNKQPKSEWTLKTKKDTERKVNANLMKYYTTYQKKYKDMFARALEILNQGKELHPVEQEKTNKDLMFCGKQSQEGIFEGRALDDIFNTAKKPDTATDTLRAETLDMYPFNETLWFMTQSGLSQDKFEETVMRCGGLLQVFVNDKSNLSIKIPEYGKRYVSVSILASRIFHGKLSEVAGLTDNEMREVAAGRAMKAFEKTEGLYRKWIEYKNKLVETGKDRDIALTLALFDDETQCVNLSDEFQLDK